MSRRYIAPAPPDNSSERSPKRLIGSDTAVSASASGSTRSVNSGLSSSVSCNRSRLTVFRYSWVPSRGQKNRPQPVRGLGGGLTPPRYETAALTHSSHHD